MKVAALAGGVGGARLADGLAQCLPPDDLTVIVNVGDDFEHYGLKICPDLDTVCYTLAGLANPVMGWGRSGETFQALENLLTLGGPTWFRLGDADLATHLERTRRLRQGQPLSQITHDFCRAWGISHSVLPATDDMVPTRVYTEEGVLPFQEYFVLRQCQPRVTGFAFDGSDRAHPAPGVLAALEAADLIVICPSNPWVSIGPILAIPGVRQTLIPYPSSSHVRRRGRRKEKKIVVAISPIIRGKTVRGPAAKMYAELGIRPSALAVAEHYQGLLTGFAFDQLDADLAASFQQSHIRSFMTDTLMKTRLDRRRLAEEILKFAETLA